MTRHLLLGVAGAITVLMVSTAAFGAEPASTDTAVPHQEIKINVTFYTWLSSLSSEITTENTQVTSEVPFGDILKALDFANFAHLEIQKGRWGLFSELDFIKLSEDTEFRNPRSNIPLTKHADGVIEETMFELGAIRSFEGERLGLDVLAGIRYFRLDSDVRVGPIESNITTDWVDPLIGARLRWKMSDKWLASLRGDLAGFGIGSGSELSTNVVAALTYSINDRYSLILGYRYFDIVQ